MALYKVRGPDGRLHEFQGPDGMPENMVNLLAGDYFQPEIAPSPVTKPQAETGFIPSVKRGARGVYSLLGDVAPAMIGKVVGAEDYAKRQMQEAAAYQQETQEKYPSAVPSYTDIKGVGDLGTYIVEAVGEAIPSIIPSLFTGGAAAIAGRTAVAAARAAAEKTVLANAAKGLGEAELKQAAMAAGVQAAKREALKYEATGALIGSAAQNIPEVYQNLYDKGKDDIGTALAFGSFNAVLDAITPINLLRKAKLSGIPEEQIIGAWYKRAGRGTIEGFATEGGTEILQEMSSAAAEKFVDENNTFYTPQNFERFINAGLKGGFGGGVITGATNVAFGRSATPGTPEAGETQADRVKAETARVEQELGLTPTTPVTEPAAVTETAVPETTITPTEPVVQVPTVTTKPLDDVQRIRRENDLAAAKATLADYEKRGVKGTPIKLTQNRIAKLERELGIAPAQGTTNVTGPITPTVGESADVSASGRSAVPATAGIETLESDGVVPAGPNVGDLTQGKGRQPAPVDIDKESIEEEQARNAGPDLASDEKTPDEYKAEQMDALQTEEAPKTAAPTEVLNEDEIIKSDARKKEDELYAAFKKIEEEKKSLLSKDGRKPNINSPNRARWDVIDDELVDARNTWFRQVEQNDAEETNAGLDELAALANKLNTVTDGNKTHTKESIEKLVNDASTKTKRSKLEIIKSNIKSTKDKIAQFSKKEKTDGVKTTKTEQTEKKGQEATDTVPVEQQNMYDEEVEYHNETNPDRKLPAYKDLMFDQKASYFGNIKKNSGEEHTQAIEDLANLVHGKAEEKKTERKTTPIKDNEDKQLQKGNNVAFLNRIRMDSKNPIRKAVAQRIFEAKLKTKVEVVNSLPEGRAAEYDPKTDTIRLTKQSQDEETLMHEYTHAATIDVINKYETDQLDKLTDDQQAAVVHLEYLMDESRKTLAEKFPDAYEDLNEFVSNAITNDVFQNALGKLSIPVSESIVPEETSLWTNLLQAIAKILRIPGLLREGNMSIEALAAFDKIVSAPPKGGIDRAPLPSRKTPEVKQAPEIKEAPKAQSDQEIADEAVDQVKLKERGGKVLLKNLFTTHGAHWMAERFQNDRYILKVREDRAALLGQLERLGDALNNVFGQITRSTGIAVDVFNTHMKFPTEAVHDAISVYAKKANISVDLALARLHIILEARHEPERRAVNYLKKVPLDASNATAIKVANLIKTPELQAMFGKTEYSAAGFREEVMNKILTQPMFQVNDDTRKAYAQELRKAMDKVVADPANQAKTIDVYEGKKLKTVETTPAMFDVADERYSVIGQRTPKQISAITRKLDSAEFKTQIDAVETALQEVHNKTIDLNKEAHYWSRPVANIVDFYGFKHYIPFKGRPGMRLNDDSFNFDSKQLGGEYQDGQDSMQGRMSEAENPILQSLADGATAALRVGKKDVTLAIKNAVNKSNRILQGDVIDNIKFEDRYKGEVNKQQISGDDKVFHYNEDGSIDVIQLTNPREKEAVRRSYRTNQPVIDLINRFTSGIGQMHTRYNPAFAPMNFVRDALTNAFTLGAELGPAKAGRLLTGIAADVSSGGLYRALNYSHLYAQGKFAEIDKLAGSEKPYDQLNDKERYYRDLKDFVKKGGRVSYLQGVAAKGALDELIKEVGRSGVLLKKEQIDKFIDIYNDMFELSSRVATYRLMKDEVFRTNVTNGMPKDRARADAEIQAVEYAKNLANFEQVGRWGKAMGALYMFFRPAATGAVRAIEATAPAFQKFNETLFREEAEAQGISKEKIDKAVKTIRERQRSARAMIGSLVGVGVGIYMMALMMSDDDEQGRNKVATDDMARWTRNARFHIPGTDIIFQMPWGFGLGTFASAGAQIASTFAGRNSVADAMSNILTTGLDSYLPLPISKISPIDNLPAWAMDSLAPSAIRPFFEYVMNLDGLGRQIYNTRQSRYGDAYTGGDSIPEIYKGAARELFNVTNGAVDWSPNTMYFFANNYVDGMAKAFTGVSNMGLTLAGKKDFDLRNDTLFLSSFIGSKSNVDAREFSKAETRIKTMEKRINALKDKPEMFQDYMESNPTDYYLVQYYNSTVNGPIRDLRAMANKIRTDKDISLRDRKERLDEVIKLQNMVKRNVLDTFESISGSPSIYR
jgi:hypothetical protein